MQTQDRGRINAAIAQFPATFGLRAYPGETFRIGIAQSYINDAGEIMLYTQRQTAGEWLDFAKGTAHELRLELVHLPAAMSTPQPAPEVGAQRLGYTYTLQADCNVCGAQQGSTFTATTLGNYCEQCGTPKPPAPASVEITPTYSVPLQRISDLLVGAFEGGSNYWYNITGADYPDTLTFRTSETFKYPADAALNPGGWLTIETLENDEIDGATQWKLDLDACKRALLMMASGKWKGSESCQKPLRFWADFMSENDDAETADVFLQLACFGEIVFG
jgi:hypothetical protein